MQAAACLLLLLPIATGLLQWRIAWNRARRWGVTLSLGVTLGVAGWLAAHSSDQGVVIWEGALTAGAPLLLAPDRLGCGFALLAGIIWFLVSLFGHDYYAQGGHPERAGSFYLFFLMALSGLMGLSLAGNLLTLYLFFELTALATLPLILLTGTRAAFSAALQYLGYSVLGAALGLWGIWMLHSMGGNDPFTPGGMLELTGGDTGPLLVCCLIMGLGFGCKGGLLPLHGWLPAAHPVAPAPASGVLSGIITKTGVLALIRLLYYVYPPSLLQGSWAQSALLTLALLSIFTGSMLAYGEKGIKRCFAFSSVSQVGYALFGVFLLTPQGLWGAVLQLVCHGMTKTALFLCAGTLAERAGITNRDQLGGIARRTPGLTAVLALCAGSLVGIPPLGGFAAKWSLGLGALEAGLGVLSGLGVFVLLLSGLLTAGYLLPMLADCLFGTDNRKPPLGLSSWTAFPLGALGTGALAVGLLPGFLTCWIAALLACLG